MKNKNKILLGLILLLSAAVRLYKLTAISLWHDEAFSALLIHNYGWKEMLYRIGLDVHPPLYYDLLRLWSYIFGNSLWSLRGFSAFFGVATVWMVYLFMKTAFKREGLALVAALLVGVSPFQIQYVTEARMYTLGTFLVMASAYFLVKALAEQDTYLTARDSEVAFSPNKLWIFWTLFAVCTAGTLYTHYYLFFSAFAIGLYALYAIVKRYKFRFAGYRYALSAYAAVFIAYIPWLHTFMFQFHQVQENYWIPKMDIWSIPLTVYKLFLGLGANAANKTTDIFLVIWTIISLLIIYQVMRKEYEKTKWLIFLGLVIPFIGSVLLSIKQSIFLDRYFLFAGLFFTITVAMFLMQIRRAWLRTALISIFALLCLFNWAKNWQEIHIDEKPGMSAASSFINNNAAASDKIFVNSSFEFFNFKYYNKTSIKPLLYTPGINHVDQLPHFSGTALLNDDDLIHNFNAGVAKGDTVWVVWTTAFGSSEPDVPSNWVELDKKSWADVRPYEGTVIGVTEYHIN